jgi:hypothetical protein
VADLSPTVSVSAEVVGAFLTAYSASHRSSCELCALEPQHDLACDYLYSDLSGSGPPLKTRLTRAAAIVEMLGATSQPDTTIAALTLHAWLRNGEARTRPSLSYWTPAESAVRAVESKAKHISP